MASRKCSGLILIAFVIVLICIILSLNSIATPDRNDNPPNRVPGCNNCHETEVDNSDPERENLSLQVYQDENEKTVNVIFSSNNSTVNAVKMQYEWNEDTEKWDIPIQVGAELTEFKNSDQAYVYDVKVANGPDFKLSAPEGGTYYVRAGYYNSSTGVKAWTEVEIFIDYANKRPTATAIFDGIETGEQISDYGKSGDSSDDYPEKTANFLFDKEGLVQLYFKPEGTDSDDNEDNLTYSWDFNNGIDDNYNSIKTDDNDTSQESPIRQLYTFYQANHYKNNWEDKKHDLRIGQIFEPNVLYEINLSVTDNHKNRAWNWANLNIKFQAPKIYPDLQIIDARFKKIDDDEDGAFEIGESMTIELDIYNTGKNSTGGIPFKLKFLDQDNKKIISDLEYKDNIEKQTKKTIIYYWTGTNQWADGVTKPEMNLEYNVTITIDSENNIDEGPKPFAEENNTYTKNNATYFEWNNEPPSPFLEIVKITLNGTDYTNGQYDIIEDYPLTINVTIKNNGKGIAEHFKLIVYLAQTDIINQKDILQTFGGDDLEPGESLMISLYHIPSITHDGDSDNQTLKFVVEYKDDEEMDSKNVKLFVTSEEYTIGQPSPPPPLPPDDEFEFLILIVVVIAIISIVAILVLIRSRSYGYENEDEDYKSTATKYKSKAKK